jgi:hypothetical protein
MPTMQEKNGIALFKYIHETKSMSIYSYNNSMLGNAEPNGRGSKNLTH